MYPLEKKILSVGAENCIFVVPMKPIHNLGFVSVTVSSDDCQMIPCQITEERYKLSEGYKISLKPLKEGFATEHFYLADLIGLIREGTVKFLAPATKPEVRHGYTFHELE
jgi:hypothetical protein